MIENRLYYRLRNAYFDMFAASWRYAKGEKKQIVLFMVLSVIGHALWLFGPYLLGQVVNALQMGGEEMLSRLMLLFGLYAAAQIAGWMLHGPSRIIERQVAFRIRVKFTDAMYEILHRLPLRWHHDHHSGETINRLNKAGRGMYDYMQSQFIFIGSAVNFIGPIAMVAILAPGVGWILAAGGAATLVVIYAFDKKLVQLYDEENRREHHFSSALFDYVSNMITVLSLRLGRRTRTELNHRLERMIPVIRTSIWVNEAKWFCLMMGIMVLEIAVVMLYVVGTLKQNNAVMLGTAVALFQYVRSMSQTFINFALDYERVIRARTDFCSVLHIIEAGEKVVETPEFNLPKEWKELALHDIRFSYEQDGIRHHLDGVSFRFRRGEKIALVGESGSGKSTLLGLLRGLYDCPAARLEVDGAFQPEGLQLLKGSTTLIPQDSEIFENTIRYNITVGMEHEEQEISTAARMACFAPVIERLEGGLESDIREKGVNLSGGEKQRLALARGLFAVKDAEIILMDEPTSSVDAGNEWKIYRQVLAEFSHATVISSLHRLYLLELFDTILVMDKGKLVEAGSLSELLAKEGHFYRLWQKNRIASASRATAPSSGIELL
jgi:ABC-type multidrug transport system fused ATPase/permease subunit